MLDIGFRSIHVLLVLLIHRELAPITQRIRDSYRIIGWLVDLAAGRHMLLILVHIVKVTRNVTQ
ncbi:hypothetical protein D3C78_1771740 [compost metagenome]